MSNSQNDTRLMGLIYQAIRLVPEVSNYLDVKGTTGKPQLSYSRQIWLNSISLFWGEIDVFDFIADMTETIEDYLTKAFNEGAREVGVETREFRSKDKAKLDEIIKKEYEFILGLGGDIEEAREKLTESEFKTQFKPRVEVWATRYKNVTDQAKIHFGKRE